MASSTRHFQVFAKPVGGACNLACRYCYYLSKEDPRTDFTTACGRLRTAGDIGRIKIQIFEEAARTTFGQEHSL